MENSFRAFRVDQSSSGEESAAAARDGASLDIYAALGLARKASPDQIREAYYARARSLHPDRNPGGEAAEFFKALTRGAEILRNPETRELYDRGHIDALGELTSKGASRRRRGMFGRTFGAYFIGPFAAGVVAISALMWSEAASLPASASSPPSSPMTVARMDAAPSPVRLERIAFTRALATPSPAHRVAQAEMRLVAGPRLVRDVSRGLERASETSHRMRERPERKVRLSEARTPSKPTVIAYAREAE